MANINPETTLVCKKCGWRGKAIGLKIEHVHPTTNETPQCPKCGDSTSLDICICPKCGHDDFNEVIAG